MYKRQDQTHSLNGSIFGSYKKWGANSVFQFGSGYPYTPVITNYESQGGVLSNVLLRNSRRKSSTFRLDLKVHRDLMILGRKGKIYLRVQNLTDRRNEITVYGDSGNSNQTIEQKRAQITSEFEPMRPNTIDEFFNRPDWYDPPRRVQLGFQLSW